jgi:hypothetical protein
MFNVYKNQLSGQTGNRNLTGPAYSLPKTMQNVENISFVSQRSLFSNVIANNNQHKVKTDFGDDASTVLKLAPLKLPQYGIPI